MPAWIIEAHLNAAGDALAAAARTAGHAVHRWTEGDDAGLPAPGAAAVFQGSLQGCVQFSGRWRPGVIGTPETLACTAWLPTLGALALNQQIIETTAGALCPESAPWPEVFARPDSPLKPFAGRVLKREALSPAAVDLGFYFDDPDLPVMLSPAVPILAEWRFVAVDGQLVAHSGYTADGRSGITATAPAEARAVAQQAADRAPAPAVVIDICQTTDRFAVVEYNLFSGADLYACDPAAVVHALSTLKA
jgi:hypothetical protein